MGRKLARVVVVLLAVVLGVAVGASPAAAERVGPDASVTLEYDGWVPGDWWRCDLSAYWVLSDGGDSFIRGDYGCNTGWAAAYTDVDRIWTPDCGGLTGLGPGDIDEDENQSGFFMLQGTGVPDDGSCMVDTMCVDQSLDGGERIVEYCDSIALGAPLSGNTPPNRASVNCPRATLVVPVITKPVAVGVDGNWRWEIHAYFEAYAKNAHSANGFAPYGLTIDGKAATLMTYLWVQNATSTTGDRFKEPDELAGGTAHRYDNFNSSVQNPGSMSLDYGYNSAGTFGQTDSVTKAHQTVRTAPLTGPVGSTPTTLRVRSAGYFTARSYLGAPTSGSTGLTNHTGPIRSEATWGGSNTGGAGDIGLNIPERCYAAWGDDWCNNEAVFTPCATAGPLVEIDAPGPVVYDPGSPEPGDPGPEPPDYEPPPVPTGPSDPGGGGGGEGPDPDDCGGFDPENPATWGDNAQCMVVLLLSRISQQLEDVIRILREGFDAVVEAIEALDLGGGGTGVTLAELEALFLPPEELWPDIWADFEAAWNGSTLDEWEASLAGLIPSAGSQGCQGPAIPAMPLVNGVETPPMHILDACGDRATAAGLVRGTVYFLITVSGAWRIWDISLGSIGAYRGGGKHMSEGNFL